MTDGKGVIVAHSPGTFAKGRVIGKEALLGFKEESACLLKVGLYTTFVVYIAGHAHDATDACPLPLAPFTFGKKLHADLRFESVLGGFLCHMQFQQTGYLALVSPGLLVNLLQETRGVHGMNHGDVGSDVFHLVGL